MEGGGEAAVGGGDVAEAGGVVEAAESVGEVLPVLEAVEEGWLVGTEVKVTPYTNAIDRRQQGENKKRKPRQPGEDEWSTIQRKWKRVTYNCLTESTSDGLGGERVGSVARGDDTLGGAVNELWALAQAVQVVSKAAASLSVVDARLSAVYAEMKCQTDRQSDICCLWRW